MGLLRAKELMLTNRMLSAEEACAWGIVNRGVPAGELMAEDRKMALSFASRPTKAFGCLRQLLHTADSGTLQTQLDLETRSIAGMMRTHDSPHGLESFLYKKPPGFKGPERLRRRRAPGSGSRWRAARLRRASNRRIKPAKAPRSCPPPPGAAPAPRPARWPV